LKWRGGRACFADSKVFVAKCFEGNTDAPNQMHHEAWNQPEERGHHVVRALRNVGICRWSGSGNEKEKDNGSLMPCPGTSAAEFPAKPFSQAAVAVLRECSGDVSRKISRVEASCLTAEACSRARRVDDRQWPVAPYRGRGF